MRKQVLVLAVLTAFRVGAAERKFDFSSFPENQTPPGFRSAVAGLGKPGDWKVILDDVPPTLAPLTPQAPAVTKRAVLAQLAQDATDEHFPLLIFQDDVFDDFTLTTRFKTVRGAAEQMAGLAFRIQDETNYYVLRASSLGNTFRFYKVVNGVRGTVIGPETPVPSGVWHELSLECEGNKIRCFLNGKQLIPTITDNTFVKGKIGFWTKSDSVSYFVDTKITFKPREVPARAVVRAVLQKYPRLAGLKLYLVATDRKSTRIVASTDESEVGQPGTDVEMSAIAQETPYYIKSKKNVSVIMPLRDRNGDVLGAVRVVLTTFPGQTEQTAVARALPIVREVQGRVKRAEDLVE